MTSPVPNPSVLSDAVREIIRQNKAVGYNPTRFIAATKEGAADNLVAVCTNLILKPETHEWLQKAVEANPSILTLEDLVTHSAHGREWGFSEEAVDIAEARSLHLDTAVGFQRWKR